MKLQCPYCGLWFEEDIYWHHRNSCKDRTDAKK